MENDDYEATGTENYLNAGCNYENEAQNFISFLLFNFFAMFIMPLFVSIVFAPTARLISR